LNTDFTVTTASTGAPIITYTDSTTQNLTYNLDRLLISEAYRRFFPVIRNSSDLVLASTSTALTGYGTVWNIENYNNTLNHNYNGTTEFSISSTGVVTMGTPLSVTYGGSGLASTTAYGVLCGGTTTTGALQNAGSGTSNYALISNGSSALPSFKNLSIGGSYLSDVSISSPANLDILRFNGTSWVNSSSLVTDESAITSIQNSLSISQGIVKSQSGVTQNSTISTAYNDGTDSVIMYLSGGGTAYASILSAITNGSAPFGYSGTSFYYGTSYTGFASPYVRVNIQLQNASQISSVINNVLTSNGGYFLTMQVYASNNVSYYNDTNPNTISSTT